MVGAGFRWLFLIHVQAKLFILVRLAVLLGGEVTFAVLFGLVFAGSVR